MRKLIGILLAFIILISPSLAKDKKVSFDAQAAWSYIKDLSSDSMQGRKSGRSGGLMGEEYIAYRFKEWSLEPAGDSGTYFQNFTIEHRHISEGVVLEVISDKARRNFYYGEDWRIQRYSGSGHFTAEIVFTGYGIQAPEKEYDDYAGVDVKGKIVLFSTGTPKKLEKKLKYETEIEKRIQAAQKLGARGVIIFRPSTDQSRYFRMRLKKEIYNPDFVILSVERKITDFIFKDLNTELRYIFREIDEKTKSMPLETGVKAFVSVNAIFDEKRPARNVLAKIRGTDKLLKDEYVIIGAHMDHLGINPLGEVMNGANDNASGTAVVMEIARIMKLNNAKPKRTVIFALWAGEEQGLLGSKHYADHPLYPIEKTIAYINLDMVGHGSGKVPFRGEYYGPQIWKALKEKLPQDILDYVKPGRGGPGGSDHTPFLGKGVPGFAVMTEGYHFKYHRSRDDIDLIKPEILKKTGDFVHAAVKILTSEPDDFIQPLRQETYYLKYQNLINFELSPLNHVVERNKDTENSHVDLQLSILEQDDGKSGNELRIEMLEKFLSALDDIEKAKGLSYYSSSNRLRMDIRQGKTTLIAGLKGFQAFGDDPRWAQVFSKQGLCFIVIDDLYFLFDEKGLSTEGKEILKAVNSSGLLLFFKGAETSKAMALLKSCKKPVILLEKDLPDKKVMELIKEKESALGLLLGVDEAPSTYFKKLDEAKKTLGTEHLMIVNEQCLWDKAGKEQMLEVISEILKAKYERSDISNIFSGTFLRVLKEARDEGREQPFIFRPF